MRHLPLLLLLAGTAAVHAQPAEAPPPPPIPDGPDLPPGAALEEPQVVIRESEGGRIEEYRVGGTVYMVKITPPGGVPYYLIDSDGDGSLETFKTGLENPNIVQWPVIRW